MMGIQGRRCGATRRIRYCLLLASASWLVLLSGCGEDAAPPPSPDARIASSRVDPTDRAEPNAESPVIVFLGTSLTAGYGLAEDRAFPALIQRRIDEAGLAYRVVNAGVSGDTSAGGLRRLDWLLRMPIAVLVLELGANDMLRGLDIDALDRNLDAILDRTAAAHPDALFLVAGMRSAPNLGAEYVDAFDSVYPTLAERHEAALIPFLLEGVAAKRNLNQADGIHPTAEGHELIAKRIWKTLGPMLQAN